jgi:hypothetical protein
MWMSVDSLKLIEPYAHSAGRALVLAQHFEATCKDILTWFHVARKIEQGKIQRWSETKAAADELVGLMLGGVIRRLGNDHEVSDTERTTLVFAKDARNYIAHEYGARYSFVSWRDSRAPKDDPRFEQEIRALAEGDNLVSSWSYMFHEKDAPPSEYMKVYPNRLVAWILSPLSERGAG